MTRCDMPYNMSTTDAFVKYIHAALNHMPLEIDEDTWYLFVWL